MGRNYSPEQKMILAKQANEDYHNNYKFQRKILYLCRKLDINRDQFVLNYPDDKSAFLELKKIQLDRLIENNTPVKPCIKTEKTKSEL